MDLYFSYKEYIMNQHLYNEQDNKNLNEQIESTVKTVALEVNETIVTQQLDESGLFQPSEETPKGARGDNMSINHIDELAFFPAGAEEAISKKIQQSGPFGSHAQKVRSFTEGGIEGVEQATNVISPVTGKPHEFSVTPEMILAAQAQCEAGGAVVLGGNGSSQMFGNIRDMFEKPTVTKRAFETFFVSHNTKVHFGIDRTIFEPSAIVRLSGKSFEKKYLEQLESYIYNSKDELDPEKLFAFIYLVDVIKKGQFPIKLVSGKHRIQLPKIIATFNTFFNKNYTVLTGISTMFNGMTVQQTPATKAE